MVAVTEIGDFFLASCIWLKSLNLSGMVAVTKIGDYFLSHTHLTSLDLSGMVAVTKIGRCFLDGCDRLSPCPTRESLLRRKDCSIA